jgi:hypothetical protein
MGSYEPVLKKQMQFDNYEEKIILPPPLHSSAVVSNRTSLSTSSVGPGPKMRVCYSLLRDDYSFSLLLSTYFDFSCSVLELKCCYSFFFTSLKYYLPPSSFSLLCNVCSDTKRRHTMCYRDTANGETEYKGRDSEDTEIHY